MKNIIYFCFILILAACGSKQQDQDFLRANNFSIYNVSSSSKINETGNQAICYDNYGDEYDMYYSEFDSEPSYSSGGYYYTSVDGHGNITVYDSDGKNYHYSTDDFGNTSGFDSKGNYYHYHTDDFGNTSGYDNNGNYVYTYTDDFGNTTGYDSNGNYYSAYTDDFGNTTITSY